jgi:hypothetical protein
MENAEKFYRLGYVDSFKPDDFFKYNDKTLLDIFVTIQYKLYLIQGDTELFFPTNETYGENIGKRISYYSHKALENNVSVLEDVKIRDYVNCFINADKKLEVKINKIELEKLGFRLGYKILSYGKNIVLIDKNRNETLHSAREVKITKEEFENIITKNSKVFKKFEKIPSEKVLLFFNDMFDE